MRADIQLTVDCHLCGRKKVYAVAPEPGTWSLESLWEDAISYFESLGWKHLPNGHWTCWAHDARLKEVA